jgi:hypothetical protein
MSNPFAVGVTTNLWQLMLHQLGNALRRLVALLVLVPPDLIRGPLDAYDLLDTHDLLNALLFDRNLAIAC